jgi:hypothetical protein
VAALRTLDGVRQRPGPLALRRARPPQAGCSTPYFISGRCLVPPLAKHVAIPYQGFFFLTRVVSVCITALEHHCALCDRGLFLSSVEGSIKVGVACCWLPRGPSTIHHTPASAT